MVPQTGKSPRLSSALAILCGLILTLTVDAATCTVQLFQVPSPYGGYRYRAEVTASSRVWIVAGITVIGADGRFSPYSSPCGFAQTCSYELDLSCPSPGTNTIQGLGRAEFPSPAMFCDTVQTLVPVLPPPTVSISGAMNSAGAYVVTVDYTAAPGRLVSRVELESEGANGQFNTFLTHHPPWYLPQGSFSAVVFHALPPAAQKYRARVFHDCGNDPEGLSSVLVSPFAAPQIPKFEFVLGEGLQTHRMLVHKYRSDDSYPSPWQIPTGPNDPPQFRFEGVVKINGSGAPGRDVWLRVIDPADPSSYVPVNSRVADDNKDPAAKGFLMPAGCAGATCRTPGGTPLRVTSGAGGAVDVILTGTDRYAGDNYQVEASFDATFTCASAGPNGTNVCTKSALVTAWKRLYVEENKMFRTGAFITETVQPGARRIAVEDVCRFPAPPFRVRLIHAPPTEVQGASFHEEEVTVRRVQADGPCRRYLTRLVSPGVLRLNPDGDSTDGDVVQNRYERPESVDRRERSYLADAVGLVSGNRNADYYVVNHSLMHPLFEEAFTEYVWMSDVVRPGSADIPYDGVLPYKERIQEVNLDTQREWLARKWLRHAQRNGRDRIAEPNHQALFLASSPELNATRLGETMVADRFNDAWVYVEFTRREAVAREVLAHEMAHQWSVNAIDLIPPVNDTGGHCNYSLGRDVEMFGRRMLCTMHSVIDRNAITAGDGIVGFHYEVVNGQPDSEFLRIRGRQEPVPQNDRPVVRNPK